jgi:AcrR family transcriptional regulator
VSQEVIAVAAQAPSRRQRYRQQTTDEIKAHAAAQVRDAGPGAVSLNAIAKTMGMSPGALYRYFENRDDLLAELAVDAYDDLGGHLETAAAAATRRTRLREVARAYRAWALAQPNTYRLIFESAAGSGRDLAADRILPASQRGMNVFLAVLSDQPPGDDAVTISRGLTAQLEQWGARASMPPPSPAVLHLAITCWTRLHGLISLEIGHHLAATGVDPQLLFEAELDQLEAMTSPRSAPRT